MKVRMGEVGVNLTEEQFSMIYLRDLTLTERADLQTKCLIAHDELKKTLKLQRFGTPPQDELWKTAYSKGAQDLLQLLQSNGLLAIIPRHLRGTEEHSPKSYHVTVTNDPYI